jgi:hypothetical protein
MHLISTIGHKKTPANIPLPEYYLNKNKQFCKAGNSKSNVKNIYTGAN